MLYTLTTLQLALANFLAQAKPEANPGAPAPAPGVPPPNGAPTGGPVSFFSNPMFLILICFAVLWFLWLMPERKKQKARVEMLKGVKKGDTVVTTAGIIGKAVRVDEREIVLQVDKDNDLRMRFLKSAIHEVVPEGAEPGGAAAKDEPKK